MRKSELRVPDLDRLHQRVPLLAGGQLDDAVLLPGIDFRRFTLATGASGSESGKNR